MSGLYQGRALETRRTGGRRRLRLGRVAFAALGLGAVVAGALCLPWAAWRARYLVVTDVRVEGVRYLEPEQVSRAAGLRPGQDAVALDLDRARQALLLHPRIAEARVTRRGVLGVGIEIVERRPVLLVRRGEPWEIDTAGVLLEPLGSGATPDLPVLTGVSFERYAAGSRIEAPQVSRGLAWVRSLGDLELQLLDEVSEVDVASDGTTVLHLLDHTRVLAPAWPPDRRTLSALRVTLVDLHGRGIVARELDLRFQDQVIVRPVDPAVPGSDTPRATSPGTGVAGIGPHA